MSASGNQRSSRRREMDFMRLCNSTRQVYPSNTVSEFWVEFRGPEGTAYEDGVWMLHVVLPDEYPFKSPSIGFCNRILHPNVDERSGSVCLDVINQTWTPMYLLENIFDVFLPQLLRYPNPADPLNPKAASLLDTDRLGYDALLREHVSQYATWEAALASIPAPFGPQHGAEETAEEVAAANAEGDRGEEEEGQQQPYHTHSRAKSATGSSDPSGSASHSKGLSDSSVTPTEGPAVVSSIAAVEDEDYEPEEIDI